jgi:hypothetical protein
MGLKEVNMANIAGKRMRKVITTAEVYKGKYLNLLLFPLMLEPPFS